MARDLRDRRIGAWKLLSYQEIPVNLLALHGVGPKAVRLLRPARAHRRWVQAQPRAGGWGAVLRQRQHVREMCGGEPGQTSNNRMELTAPIMALEALTRPVVVHLYTDSTYVRNGITKWVLGWERSGWKTAAKQPVKYVDLWQRLQSACARHRVEWFWVKGHAGVADNELADELATRGMQQAIALSAAE